MRKIKMLQGSGSIIYRHRINPEVRDDLKGITDRLQAKFGILISQSLIIARAIEMYRGFIHQRTDQELQTEMSRLFQLAGKDY